MRIYDSKSKVVLQKITLFLTPDEASELADLARELANDPKKHHGHVTTVDYSQELTIAVYTAENLSAFDPESRAILEQDKWRT